MSKPKFQDRVKKTFNKNKVDEVLSTLTKDELLEKLFEHLSFQRAAIIFDSNWSKGTKLININMESQSEAIDFVKGFLSQIEPEKPKPKSKIIMP